MTSLPSSNTMKNTGRYLLTIAVNTIAPIICILFLLLLCVVNI